MDFRERFGGVDWNDAIPLPLRREAVLSIPEVSTGFGQRCFVGEHADGFPGWVVP